MTHDSTERRPPASVDAVDDADARGTQSTGPPTGLGPSTEERHRRLLALTQDSVWTLVFDEPLALSLNADDLARAALETGRFTDCSAAFERRVAAEEASSLEGLRPRELPRFWLHADDARLVELASAGFRAAALSVTELDRTGHPRRWAVELEPLADGRGLVGLSAIERDITDDEEEDELIREGTELFKAVTRAAFDGLVVIDADHRLVDCNESFARLVGLPIEELLSRGSSPLRPRVRDDGDPYAAIADARLWLGEGVVERADGTSQQVDLSCYRARSGSFYFFVRGSGDRDVAERRDREHHDALAHVARLSTLGEMASGIAHEFNQPLAAIVNYANGCMRLLEQRGVDDQMVFRALRSIVDQGKRASEIIRRLRSFARRGDDDREAFSFRDLLRDAVALTSQPRSKAGVGLDMEFADQDDTVVVDGIQIEQVVMNLILNAVESLGRLPSGEPRAIRVSTRFVGTPGSGAAPGPDAGPAGFVEACVEDSGPGVDQEVAQHLFEPFYSAHRKGLGLGLTIGRSIVEAHGGRLWLEQRAESENASGGLSGARFRFTLPVRRGQMDP